MSVAWKNRNDITVPQSTVNWNVTLDNVFNIDRDDWDKDEDGKMNDGESTLLSNYSDEQNKLRRKYKNSPGIDIDKNAYYVFLLNGIESKSGLAGYMPLKNQYAFIYSSGMNVRTIAHELGHGAFRLWHTFSSESNYYMAEKSSDNLMDYNDGDRLHKYQWDFIHNPEGGFYMFTDEEEGAMMNSHMSKESIKSIIDLIRNDNIAKETKSDLTLDAWSKGITANLELTSDFTLDYIEVGIKSGKNIGTEENPLLFEDLIINPKKLKFKDINAPSGQEGDFVKVYYNRLDKAIPPYTGYTESDSLTIFFIIKETQKDEFEEHIFDEKRNIIIEINRIRTDTSRTVGVIEIDNGAITGFTLELQEGTSEECCSTCTDLKKADNNCHRILAGTYDCDITTYSEKAHFVNKSLRLEDVSGRTGILIHRGVNARIWSYGCILAMRNDPTNDADDASVSERANIVTDSENFCIEIVNYIDKRKARIREIFNITDVDIKISINETVEINN